MLLPLLYTERWISGRKRQEMRGGGVGGKLKAKTRTTHTGELSLPCRCESLQYAVMH